ncbi:hypothetical protein N431DRAFT_388744 [Stipitochalara longipes BDJ]|nr:hypothetical protein N431DRAFT_388744 [Stipitochalara longipes BDJ]
MTLHALPDELLIFVLRQLESRNDLSNLALCSRRFHNLALPVLYSSFKDDGALLRTLPFLSTIVRRPDLVRYVKNVAIDGRDFALFPPGPFDEDWDPIEAALKRIFEDESLDLRVRWRGAFYEWENWDAVTALVICLLPNMATLNLPFYPGHGDHVPKYIPYVISQAAQLQMSNLQPTHYLRKLRQLTIANSPKGPTPLDCILPFLKLGSLSTFTCFALELFEEYIDLIKELPAMDTTQVSFPHSDFHSVLFAEFLKKLPHLTHLSYIHQSDDKYYEPNDFVPPTIREGLMHSKHCLQELTLVNDNEAFELFTWGSEPPPLGSLVEFEKLRQLDATVYTLVGRAYTLRSGHSQNDEVRSAINLSLSEMNVQFVESLPQSLEGLVVRNCAETIWSLMDVIFEQRRKGMLKRLRTATFVLYSPAVMKQSRSQEAARKFVQEGKQLGILVAFLDDLPII